MVYVPVRLPPDVDAFYAAQGDNKSDAIREVLVAHARAHKCEDQ